MNLITVMERDKMPLPRFWYLPRGEKAVVVMSGDDHSPTRRTGGTASHFDRYKALSPAGCSVVNWDCVRSTSLHLSERDADECPGGRRTPRRASRSASHPARRRRARRRRSPRQSSARIYDTQLAAFPAKYTSVPAQVSSRTHCVYWPDWASNAKVELARGIRMDANYYHYPGPWIGAKPGFMNGGGFPMRFADLDGTLIDVYQQNTNMTDESTTNYPTSIDALLDNAIGSLGYYGAFGANMHTDNTAPHPGAEAIVASAQARSVPVISYKQLLDVGRRPQQLDDPRPQLERRHLHLCHHRRRGRERPADDAADPGPHRHADRDHARRLARHVHGADDQGHPIRDVHRGHSDVRGDVLIETDLIGRLGRSWTDARCPGRRHAAENEADPGVGAGAAPGCWTICGERD